MKPLLRKAAGLASSFIAKLAARRRYDPEAHASGGKLMLNLGCGLAVATGWVNIDASLNSLIAVAPRILHRLAYRFTGANRYYTESDYCRILSENRFLHCDLTTGIPYGDGTVDCIFSSHFAEHLTRLEARALFAEIYRVLKPGGVARINVPDLEHALALYQGGHKKKALENYFFVEDQDNPFSQHRYMYDFELLSEALLDAGFAAVERKSYRCGRIPGVETLDNRPDETLFVEARK